MTRRWLRGRESTPRPEVPPEGVRLHIGDREYPCDVLRDPDRDENGCAAWICVPREPLPPGAVPCSVSADMLPAKSSLLIELDLGTGGDW